MDLQTYLVTQKISQAEFARRVGVTRSLISQWILRTRPISAEKVIPVERASDGMVTRHELRPDIYPQEETTPAKKRKPLYR